MGVARLLIVSRPVPPRPLHTRQHHPQRWHLGTAGTRTQGQSCWTRPACVWQKKKKKKKNAEQNE